MPRPISVVRALAAPVLVVSLSGGAGGGDIASPPLPPRIPPLVGDLPGGPGPTPAARAPVLHWRWPTEPVPEVLRRFVAPRGPYGPGHRGIDLRVPEGTAVRSVADGLVTHAGTVGGRGTVTVQHGDGLASTYEPVRPLVRAGDAVMGGSVLGVLEAARGTLTGSGHCVLVPCLHLGARRGGAYLDPLLLLRGGRVRLLPLGPGQSVTGYG